MMLIILLIWISLGNKDYFLEFNHYNKGCFSDIEGNVDPL